LNTRPKLRKMDMRCDNCDVKKLYKAGSLLTVAKEISKYIISYIQWKYNRSDGTEVAPNQQTNIRR
jgi:hypothetical protein